MLLAVTCCPMASEEHRTENRVHSQSVYTQPVVVDEHVTHVAARKVAIRGGVEENHETRFLRRGTTVKPDRILRSSLPAMTRCRSGMKGLTRTRLPARSAFAKEGITPYTFPRASRFSRRPVAFQWSSVSFRAAPYAEP